MDCNIQITPLTNDQFGVTVDGRFAGKFRKSGDSVLWQPWYFHGSLRLNWQDFMSLLKPAA